MPQKYTDPINTAAWEIFVQLVAHQVDLDPTDAVTKAFDYAKRFDLYCEERQRNEKRRMHESPGENRQLSVHKYLRIRDFVRGTDVWRSMRERVKSR